jgi:hypothetical protein
MLYVPREKEDKKKVQYPVGADQAEGERNEQTSTKVGRTPGQAEGDRETVEESLRNKERKQGK